MKVQSVSAEVTMRIIKQLSSGVRFSGTPFAKKSIDYIVDQFRKFGLNVEIQNFKFMGWHLLDGPKMKFLTPKEADVTCLPMVWSGSTPENGVRGELEYVGKTLTFEGYGWNKYAITDDGGQHLAYIITRPDMVWLQPVDDPSITTPHIVVDADACTLIEGWRKAGKPIKVWAYVRTRYNPDSSFFNVIATLRGKRNSERKIIICGHHDSMYKSPGANDNASGVAVILNLAQVLSKQDIPKTVQFTTFDAEEWNKLGSNTYVKTLEEMGRLRNIDLVINIDMVGAGQFIYLSHDIKPVDDRLRLHIRLQTDRMLGEVIREIGGIEATPNSFKLGDTNIEIRTEVRPSFDHWPFYKTGIPIIHLGCGPYPYVHGPEDTHEKIDPKIIDLVTKIVLFILKKSLE